MKWIEIVYKCICFQSWYFLWVLFNYNLLLFFNCQVNLHLWITVYIQVFIYPISFFLKCVNDSVICIIRVHKHYIFCFPFLWVPRMFLHINYDDILHKKDLASASLYILHVPWHCVVMVVFCLVFLFVWTRTVGDWHLAFIYLILVWIFDIHYVWGDSALTE